MEPAREQLSKAQAHVAKNVEYIRGCSVCAIASVVIGGILLLAVLRLFYKVYVGWRGPVLLEKRWKKDIVYLYMMHGTPTLPSICPFCIKVEAYLRLHEIKFERRYVVCARGTNGKLPFIELNGAQIADSYIILCRLAKHFDLKEEFSNERDPAIGHALSRQVEGHTESIFGYFKVTEGARELVKDALGGHYPVWQWLTGFLPLRHMLLKRMRLNFVGHAQYQELLEHELVGLQTLLGEHQYLFGSEITTPDLVLFAHLAGVLYFSADTEPKRLLNSSKFEPLKLYTERVRDAVFLTGFHE